jgi:hypothetical protein
VRPRIFGSVHGRCKRFFSSTYIKLALGHTRPHSPEVKRLGRKADYSLPSSISLRVYGGIPPSPYTFMMADVVLN